VAPIKEGFRLLKYILKLVYIGLGMALKPVYKSIMIWIEEGNKKREIRWEAKQEIKRRKEKAIWDKWSAYYKAHPEKLLELKNKQESAYERITQKLRQWRYDDWRDISHKVHKVAEKLADDEWIKEAEEARIKAAQYLEEKKKQFLSFYKGDDTEALLSDGSFEVVLRKYEKEKKQAQIEAEAARLRANKARINHILKMTKPITAFLAYTLGSAAVLVALYYVWQFIYWSYEGFTSVKHTTYVDMGNILGKVGLVLLIIAVFLLLVFFVRELILKIASSKFHWPKVLTFYNYFPKKEYSWTKEAEVRNLRKQRRLKRKAFIDKYILDPVLNVLSFIYEIISKFCKSIRNAGIFVVQMLKNNCPAIEWRD
jgi:hypothetical protein